MADNVVDKEIIDLPESTGVTGDTVFPGYVPGALNPAQKITAEQLKTFFGQEIAIVTYGDALADVEYQHATGKFLICKNGSYFALLAEATSSAFVFRATVTMPGVNRRSLYEYTLDRSSGEWDSGAVYPEYAYNKVNTIDSSSTVMQYPSAKAVYDLAQSLVIEGGGGGGLPGTDGEDGGYYIPNVSQPDQYTMQVDFTASKDGMAQAPTSYINLPPGPQGPQGQMGQPGSPGSPGMDGADGKSAYEYAQDAGYAGTEAEFAEKLAAESVLTIAQELSEEQQAQARTNIGAASEDSVNQLSDDIADLTKTVEPEADDIPKVFISGEIPTTKDDVLAEMEYNSSTDRFKAYLKIKCQGSSSMEYPKKNYTVKMYSDEAREVKLEKTFRDWGVTVNKYVLKANYIDHSHARNIVSARLWDEVVSSRTDYDSLPTELKNSPRNGAVDGFPVKVYANGTYQGLYTWNIGKDAWLWGMDEDNANHVLLCNERNDNGTVVEKSSSFRALWDGLNGTDWSVEVGSSNSEATKNSLNALISCVMNTTDDEFKAQIGTYLDVQSALDYFLFSYVNCGLDNLGKNMLLATYDGKKWYCGQYDLDSTFGLWWNGGFFVSPTYACPDDYQEAHSLLWERIEALYIDELKARYAELRASVLSFPNMVTHFERFMDAIGSELYAEDLTIYEAIPSGDTNNIKQIRDFIRDRLEYVDEKIRLLGAGYDVLEYIESSGTQYIDTEIQDGANAAYEIVFTPLSAGVSWQFYCGHNSSRIPWLQKQGAGNAITAGSTLGSTNVSITPDEQLTVIYSQDGSLTFNGVAVELPYAPAGYGWWVPSWHVFTNGYDTTLCSNMRLHSLRMWTDGELVRDFIPVKRQDDEVVCLFDRVTESFFENAGTGEFIAGSVV